MNADDEDTEAEAEAMTAAAGVTDRTAGERRPDRLRERLDRSGNDLREWRSGEGRVLGARIPPPRDGHLSVAVPPGFGDRQPEREPELPADRIWTIPNAISAARLLLIPVLVVCLLVWDAPGWALVLLAVLGVSDWLDGKIARLWDMRSRLGEKLDPLADRVLVVVVPVVFALVGYVPWWTIAVLLARDLVLAATLIPYRRLRVVPEVIYLGKAATFALFWSFPLLLAGEAGLPGHVGLRIVGEACLYWGVSLYVWSGLVYVWQAGRVVRTMSGGGSGGPPTRARHG